MGNVNVNRIGKDAARDGELSYDERISRNVVEVDPWRPAARPDAAQIVAVGGVLGAAWVVVLIVLGVARLVACWDACYAGPGLVGVLLWAWLSLPVVGALLGATAWLWGYVARTQAETARTSVTRDRFGNPVSAPAVLRQSPDRSWAALELATRAKIATAPYEVYRGADALSLTQSPAAAAAQLEAAPVAPSVVVERPTDWLAWLGERPHLLLAAESGAGKSVLENVALDFLMTPQSAAVIIDCHWSPLVESDEGRLVPKWGGIAPAATTYAEARETLNALRVEYERRLEQLRTGQVLEGRFPPIFIMIDETPEVMREIMKLDRADIEAKSLPKGTSTWADGIVVFGSGGRKVNMYGHLLSQSPLVEDIGMNSAMRKNFFRIALAHAECRKLIGEEPDAERKAALLEALKGRRFPAAVERNGEVWILSRDGLLEMMPERISAAAWVEMPAPSVRSHEPENALQPAPSGRTDGRTAPIDVVSLLRTLRRAGISRDAARDQLRRAGIEFENALWTKAGQEGATDEA
jgi:hypothetical protein